ncbi:MAG: phosphoenolpyruvate-protein phosphotransferase [Gemmatimonadales bacterium]|nr:MAG: phosphoenolpyruvate-protein phosphotransferase [Gemmatimonadales bacterium]
MTESERILTGIGVSPGIAVGRAHVLSVSLPVVPHRVVPKDQVEAEVERLRRAVGEVREHLEALRDRAAQRAGPREAKIFDAQIMMLEDSDFLGAVEKLIRENQLSAERAFEFKSLEMRALWSASSRLRERLPDLSAVQLRVLHHLLGQPVEEVPRMADGEPVILFTRELTPGLTVQFDREHIAGFASEEGTRTSHAAILAHSLGIPCVMGLVGSLERVRSGMPVILDGAHGLVILEPTAEEIKSAQAYERRRLALERELERAVDAAAVTADGVRLRLLSNVDTPEDVELAVSHGAEGVGLLRTEFLVLGRASMPDEEEQASYFAEVGRRFGDKPVVIRSYDLGGDKFPLEEGRFLEANPFLGWRALRVCLDRPDVFKPQIRAMLRARAEANIQLMIPLVTQVEEVARTREMIAEAADELAREGKRAASELPLGVMIETPAAVMLADELAEASEFLSVGTNDLTQYTLVVDRGNARLAGRFTPHHPSILRMLKLVLEAGKRRGREPSVCGEMASDPLSAFLLIGLGYRVLSVAPLKLPLVRWLVRQVDAGSAERAASSALEASTAADVREILEKAIGEFVDLKVLEAGRLPRAKRESSLSR